MNSYATCFYHSQLLRRPLTYEQLELLEHIKPDEKSWVNSALSFVGYSKQKRIIDSKFCEDFIFSGDLAVFKCELFGKLPVFPVKDAITGEVYEFEALHKWIVKKPSKSPILDRVEFDFAHILSINDRVFRLMQNTIEALDPQKHVLIEGINFFFDKYGKKGILPEVKGICLEYLEAEVSQVEENNPNFRNHRKLIIDYLTNIISRNVTLIINERKSLLNIYEQEWKKSHAFPSKKLAQVASVLHSNPRKVAHKQKHPTEYTVGRDQQECTLIYTYYILKTIEVPVAEDYEADDRDHYYWKEKIKGRKEAFGIKYLI